MFASQFSTRVGDAPPPVPTPVRHRVHEMYAPGFSNQALYAGHPGLRIECNRVSYPLRNVPCAVRVCVCVCACVYVDEKRTLPLGVSLPELCTPWAKE